MSNWNFEDMGDFADDAAAERWAKRNDIALRDIRTIASGRGVRLEVRRSSLGDNRTHNDLRDGRIQPNLRLEQERISFHLLNECLNKIVFSKRNSNSESHC